MQNWVPCLVRKSKTQCTRSMEPNEYLVESTAFWLILRPELFHLVADTSNFQELAIGKGLDYVQRSALSNALTPCCAS